MANTFKRAMKRFGRGFLSLLIAGAISITAKDPKWLVLAPVIQGVAKYLRDKFGLKYTPV